MFYYKKKHTQSYINISIVFLLFIYIIGCSPKARYNVLSIFLDGVPNPDKNNTLNNSTSQNKASDTTGIKNIKEAPKITYSYHPPYASKKCQLCHDPNIMGKVLEPLPGLCYKCHKSFDSTYAFVHGPVASGNCTACHSPHFASEKKLLMRKGQDVCLLCHSKNDILKNENHKDIGETNCTECHNPHGGTTKYFLN